MFGSKKIEQPLPLPVVDDGSAWILDNGFAEFVLLNSAEIKYMCLVGYTFMHGCKAFKNFEAADSYSYKAVSLILACTGGGILVPIFLNKIPAPAAMDSYPIAIALSFLLHTNFPVLREVLELSPVFKASMVFLYEVLRASVVMKFTILAGSTIAPSEFDFAVFGPIFCGTISGCGGAFLPMNKGLNPIKKDGLAPPMFSALVGATFVHFFTNMATDVVDAQKKAHVILAVWFVLYGLYSNGIFTKSAAPKATSSKAKKEKAKKSQ